MTVYYNEFNPNAAQWLRNLGEENLIEKGVVDERSIKSVAGSDLAGVRRAHFFAGIGGWDLALRLAGWGDAEVWTGSCPCQPYSSAGKGLGDADARNLWPDFFRLIKERRPQSVFGEQVASAIKHGWLDRVFADLEGIGYTCGAAVLGAHSVGANHIRQRLYWGAQLSSSSDAGGEGLQERGAEGVGRGEDGGGPRAALDGDRATGGIQHATGDGREQRGAESCQRGLERGRGADGLGENSASIRRGRGRDGDSPRDDGQIQTAGLRSVGGFSNNNNEGLKVGGRTEQDGGSVPGAGGADGRFPDGDQERLQGCAVSDRGRQEIRHAAGGCAEGGPWNDFRVVLCSDRKARRTGARVFPLAYGLPRGVGQGGTWRKGLARSASRARVGMLKGSGNAIVPELAAEFIRAFRESNG